MIATKRNDAGSYVKDIVASLKSRGISNRGKPFAKSTVYRMFTTERYAGVYRFENEVYENMYPKIIDKELYTRVKAKADSLKHGSTSNIKNYLLSRKLVCGYCGQSINGSFGTSKTGTKKILLSL